MALSSPTREKRMLFAAALLLTLAAAVTLYPLWPPILLAIWTATLGRPLVVRLTRRLGGKQRASALFVLLLLIALVTPLALVGMSLAGQAVDLMTTLSKSEGARNALAGIVSGGGGGATIPSIEELLNLARRHGAQALGIIRGIAGATANALVGVFIFFFGAFALLADGPAYYEWLKDHSPFPAVATKRLTGALTETGRGLLIGVGLTGLAQGTIATIAYFALGVPRAFVLGFLTCIASLIPSVGTAIVWVPVAAGLALTGRTVAAIILAAIGVLVISTIDNVLRPIFARFGELRLSTFTLFVAIFGGLATFGAWGLLLGPLVVRLAKEALAVTRDLHAPTRKGDAHGSSPPPAKGA